MLRVCFRTYAIFGTLHGQHRTSYDEPLRSVPGSELGGPSDMCSLNKPVTVVVLCDFDNHAVEALHS